MSGSRRPTVRPGAVGPVLVAGPASWNELVYLDALPEATPHTVFARSSRRAVGGTSAGKALNLAALGRGVTLRTVLGADDEAGHVEAVLRAAGVDVVVDRTPDGRTERHLNLMGGAGERLSVYLHAPGDVPLAPASRARVDGALDAAPVAVVDLAPHALGVLDDAVARGVPVWCDVHDWDGLATFHRPWVEAATVLFLSSERLEDPAALMRARVAAGTALVVCTHGARGASALCADGTWTDVPAVPVARVVDTNGAGDGFFAGFLDAHLAGARVPDALAAGARHAAAVVASPDLAPRP